MTDDDAAAQARKVAENRLRRTLRRRGYTLIKSKLRDVRAIGYGTYKIADANNVVVAGERMRLDDVEVWVQE